MLAEVAAVNMPGCLGGTTEACATYPPQRVFAFASKERRWWWRKSGGPTWRSNEG